MMQWKKDPTKKYTDLCIYIDANIEKLRNPGEYPDVENTIYNYLWLLVKALAIKKCMFQNFEDYDPYSFHAANRLFFALRKNLQNQGKTVKGKLIKPIKSCLNYTKALLYPMKIEYQREAYREILDEEYTSKKFDAFSFRTKLQDAARNAQMGISMFPDYLKDSFAAVSILIDDVLKSSPFKNGSLEYKKVKMSIILNCLNNIRLKKHLDADSTTIILWKLPKSMASYVKILLKEFYTELKKEIMECYRGLSIDDTTADQILTYKEGSDYQYDD